MTKQMAMNVLENVTKNLAILKECPKHGFVELESGELETSGILYEPRSMARRYKCLNCGGQLESITVYWYNKGLQHGSKA